MPGYKVLAPNPIHKSLSGPQRTLWIVIFCQAIPAPKSEPSMCTEALSLQNLLRVPNLTWKKAHYHSRSLLKAEKQHSGTDLTKSHICSFSHSIIEIYFLHLLTPFYQEPDVWKGEWEHDIPLACRILANSAWKCDTLNTRLPLSFCHGQLPRCQQGRS